MSDQSERDRGRNSEDEPEKSSRPLSVEVTEGRDGRKGGNGRDGGSDGGGGGGGRDGKESKETKRDRDSRNLMGGKNSQSTGKIDSSTGGPARVNINVPETVSYLFISVIFHTF